MKSSDRTILMVLGVLGLLAAAWFLLISPKRGEVAKLDDEIAEVQSSLTQQEALAAAAEAARDNYHSDYREMVVLGKAVPGDEDTSSLFVELESIADRSGVDFDSIELAGNTGAAAPPPPAQQTTADNAEEGDDGGEGSSGDGASTVTAVPAPPTEAAAAALPIGATVGPAGLPVMPYTISLSGNFFQIADFLAGVDKLVEVNNAKPVANGRLITVDSFELTPVDPSSDQLSATLTVTTYVSPADQGVTAGATPAAPAASSAVPTTTSTPTP